MPTILDEIVTRKRLEIEAAKARRSEAELELAIRGMPPVRDFAGALKRPGMRVIAEVKKASPSAGVIRADFDPVAIARIYEAHHADALSVLTDEHFFQGSLAYLTSVHEAVGIPVLRKEFILERYQLLEARTAGADAVLLIAECLPSGDLAKRFAEARAMRLHVLVELHDPLELTRVLDTGAEIIGINNRDLRSFHTTLDTTLDLLQKIPAGKVVVSESGIRTHADLVMLEKAGVKAILVGESLMRAVDIGLALDQLRGGI